MSDKFRYYMHDGPSAFSFELAGKLSDNAAGELEQAWRTASSVRPGRSLIVDISYVTQVDLAGRAMLRRWHDGGAQLVAKSPQARAIAASITGQSPEFIAANADRVREALAQVPAEARASVHLAFTAHSIPMSMAANWTAT